MGPSPPFNFVVVFLKEKKKKKTATNLGFLWRKCKQLWDGDTSIEGHAANLQTKAAVIIIRRAPSRPAEAHATAGRPSQPPRSRDPGPPAPSPPLSIGRTQPSPRIVRPPESPLSTGRGKPAAVGRVAPKRRLERAGGTPTGLPARYLRSF